LRAVPTHFVVLPAHVDRRVEHVVSENERFAVVENRARQPETPRSRTRGTTSAGAFLARTDLRDLGSNVEPSAPCSEPVTQICRSTTGPELRFVERERQCSGGAAVGPGESKSVLARVTRAGWEEE
jgi:hypothetical protein